MGVFVLLLAVIALGIVSFKLPCAEWIFTQIEWSPVEYFATKMCTNVEESAECARRCNSWLPWSVCPRQCFPCYYAIDEWPRLCVEVFFSGTLLLSVLGLIVQRHLIWRHKW